MEPSSKIKIIDKLWQNKLLTKDLNICLVLTEKIAIKRKQTPKTTTNGIRYNSSGTLMLGCKYICALK